MTEHAVSSRRARLLERFRARALAATGVAMDACTAEQWTMLRRQLHSIKGDARMLSLESLATYVELIYDSVSEKSMSEAEALRVHEELAQLAVMLTGPLEQSSPEIDRLAQVRSQLRSEHARRAREHSGCVEHGAGLVMVVDDSPVVRMMLAASLRARGAEVLALANVEQTLEAVAKRRPRVILSDIEMPGAGGFALLERIRERDTKLPVVLLSGDMGEREQRRAVELGASGVFEKSSDMSGVVEHVLDLAGC